MTQEQQAVLNKVHRLDEIRAAKKSVTFGGGSKAIRIQIFNKLSASRIADYVKIHLT